MSLTCKNKCFYYRGDPVFGSEENQRLVLAKIDNMHITRVDAHMHFADEIAQKIYDQYQVKLSEFDVGWIANCCSTCTLSLKDYDRVMTDYHKKIGELDKINESKAMPAIVNGNVISRAWVDFCVNNGL
jgi:hypothetical protein